MICRSSTAEASATAIQVFNAFQLVFLFAALPFVLGWLWHDPFRLAAVAFWATIGLYNFLFGVLWSLCYDSIEKGK